LLNNRNFAQFRNERLWGILEYPRKLSCKFRVKFYCSKSKPERLCLATIRNPFDYPNDYESQTRTTIRLLRRHGKAPVAELSVSGTDFFADFLPIFCATICCGRSRRKHKMLYATRRARARAITKEMRLGHIDIYP
jgi:hypothetical protein